MRSALLLFLFFLILNTAAFAQKPVNDDCTNAISLTILSDKGHHRTGRQAYTNDGATPGGLKAAAGWSTAGLDVWFKFTARESVFSVTIQGWLINGTLQNPLVALYKTSDCKTYEEIAGKSSSYKNQSATFYTENLKYGETYYIRVSGANNNHGTFSMFAANTKKMPLGGADYETALELCNREHFIQQGFSGAGNDNREGAGTVLDKGPVAIETNSLWYKWTAANSEKLRFTIQPTAAISLNDNFDFVLYDLGTDPQTKPNAANVVRASAAIGCDEWPHVETGVFASGFILPISPYRDCAYQAAVHYNNLPGGFTDDLRMEKGHVYALLVNTEVPPEHNLFELEFGEFTTNKGEFEGPKAIIDMKVDNPCTAAQNYTFASLSTGAASVKWTFDADATVTSSTDIGPFKVGFAQPGPKTVILDAITAGGCYTRTFITFVVGVTPDKPVAKSDKTVYCTSDTIVLSTPQLPYNTYHWTGPNNFSADGATVLVPITDGSVAGTYTLVARQGNCESLSTTITIPAIIPAPKMAFLATPVPPVELLTPARVTFVNQSSGADSYLWTFGDGTTSTEFSPTHTYQKAGSYNVKLSGIKTGVCTISVIKGEFTITAETALFVPNTFTPNGDGINDVFKINISTMSSYRLRIYNRWGQLVYQTVNADDYWDGRMKNQPVSAGTYYYTINGIDQKNKSIEKTGSVTVLR